MKSKIDWKNKELLTKIATDSISYADMLRKLGLSTVSSNVTTLKKHINNHNINVSHFTSGQTVQSTPPSTQQSIAETPTISQEIPTFTLTITVPTTNQGIKTELEWNDSYIMFLKNSGYGGIKEDDIISDFLAQLLVQLAEYRQTQGEFKG